MQLYSTINKPIAKIIITFYFHIDFIIFHDVLRINFGSWILKCGALADAG